MEAEQSIRILDRILKVLSKLKCKIMCCCKSSCVMDGQEPQENISISNIDNITEL